MPRLTGLVSPRLESTRGKDPKRGRRATSAAARTREPGRLRRVLDAGRRATVRGRRRNGRAPRRLDREPAVRRDDRPRLRRRTRIRPRPACVAASSSRTRASTTSREAIRSSSAWAPRRSRSRSRRTAAGARLGRRQPRVPIPRRLARAALDRPLGRRRDDARRRAHAGGGRDAPAPQRADCARSARSPPSSPRPLVLRQAGGDRFLLCTDGLWGPVPAAELARGARLRAVARRGREEADRDGERARRAGQRDRCATPRLGCADPLAAVSPAPGPRRDAPARPRLRLSLPLLAGTRSRRSWHPLLVLVLYGLGEGPMPTGDPAPQAEAPSRSSQFRPRHLRSRARRPSYRSLSRLRPRSRSRPSRRRPSRRPPK